MCPSAPLSFRSKGRENVGMKVGTKSPVAPPRCSQAYHAVAALIGMAATDEANPMRGAESVREATSHRSHLSGLLLLSEVAEAARVSVWTVRAEIGRGHLRATRIGRLLHVTYQDCDAWIASRAERHVAR